MTIHAAAPIEVIEIEGITPSVEIVFDANASETTVEFPGADPGIYTIVRDRSHLLIRQNADYKYSSNEALTVVARRMAREKAAQQGNLPGAQTSLPKILKDGGSAGIIITTGPAMVKVLNCQDVVGTIDGVLHVVASSDNYLAISGAHSVCAYASGTSTIKLSNVKGDLGFHATGQATITTDSTPGEIWKSLQDMATFTVV